MPNPVIQSEHDLLGIRERRAASPAGRSYWYHKFVHELTDAVPPFDQERRSRPDLYDEIQDSEIDLFIARLLAKNTARMKAAEEPVPRASSASNAIAAPSDGAWPAGRTRPRLSILIPSMHARAPQLAKLLKNLSKQAAAAGGAVEVLIDIDAGVDATSVSTGEKRNRLLARANGDYVVFVDDDDEIHPRYVALILAALDSQPGVDCVAITGEMIRVDRPGHPHWKFHHSLRYTEWRDARDPADRHERCPNHINPIRRELAQSVKFPHNNVEDRPWSLALRPLLKTEVEVQETLYTYLARA